MLTDLTTDRADLDWYLVARSSCAWQRARTRRRHHSRSKHYRWKNRILVVSARKRDDARLTELQTELASAAEEFADRDMVLVTLLDDGTSTVEDQELTAAEAAATPRHLGDTGRFILRCG